MTLTIQRVRTPSVLGRRHDVRGARKPHPCWNRPPHSQPLDFANSCNALSESNAKAGGTNASALRSCLALSPSKRRAGLLADTERRRRWALPAQAKAGRFALMTLAALALVTSARAQAYSIDWFTIDGGGGSSTGGAYSVSGIIGEPNANPHSMTGGNFSLVGGFWSLSAVQTPDGPLLTIRLTTTNTALVLWPSPSTGFLLLQSTDLTATGWATVPETVTDNGVNKSISANPAVGNRVYRLFKP